MAIEIVDLPIGNGGSFHSYMAVYQEGSFFDPKFKTGRFIESQFENQETSVLTHNPVRILQTKLGEIEQKLTNHICWKIWQIYADIPIVSNYPPVHQDIDTPPS